MEPTVTLHDKTFAVNIREAEIQKSIVELARRIDADFEGKTPLFVGVLNGSFMFLADLMKHVTIPCEVSFVKLASYEGTSSTGAIKQLVGLNENIHDRTVIIVEDIVDTGNTIEHMIDSLKTQRPKEIKVATLLFKPEAYTKDIPVDYVALSVPNDFLVGYGLDYDGLGRNLKHIYKITE